MGGDLAEENHTRSQFQAEARQVGRAGLLQSLRDFHHFQSVANGIAERLVHVGDERLDLLVHAAANANHGLRQAAGFHLRLHEGTIANLHVEHEGIYAFRHLLRHDGRSDERYGFHGASDIAERVDAVIGRRHFVVLANKTEPEFSELSTELLHGQIGSEAGDGLQLVQGAAGVAQATSGNHRHHHASSGRDRSTDQTGFIANPTRGVFIYFHSRDLGQRNHFAGLHHALGQGTYFSVRHTAKIGRHEEGGHLVIRNFTRGVSVHKELDLFHT